MINPNSLAELQAENARLIALLENHGIEWRLQPELPPPAAVSIEPEISALSTAEKVTLFRRLFRGRTDVYPVRLPVKRKQCCYINKYQLISY